MTPAQLLSLKSYLLLRHRIQMSLSRLGNGHVLFHQTLIRMRKPHLKWPVLHPQHQRLRLRPLLNV